MSFTGCAAVVKPDRDARNPCGLRGRVAGRGDDEHSANCFWRRPHEGTHLNCRQSRWKSRDGFGVQTSGPFPSVRLPPAKDETHGLSHLTGDCRQRVARLPTAEQPGAHASPVGWAFQEVACAIVPSTSANLCIFMQDSITY